MKLLPSSLEYFISPITGKLVSHTILPSLEEDYVWEGNIVNEPVPSPVLIDMRLDTANLRNDVDYILDRYLLNNLSEGKIWVGNTDNRASESLFSIDDFVKNEGDTFEINNIAVWSDVDGQFIKDSGISIPDLKSLADAAAASAESAKSSAEAAGIAATLAGGYKTEAQTAAASAAADAVSALASAGEATAAAVLAATYAGDAAESADDAYDEAVLANNHQKAAKEYMEAAQVAAASALASKNTCEDILAELYSTGLEFVGDIIGSGPINSPILTTLNLTLDQIPWPGAAVNLNGQKITNLATGSSANDAVNFGQLSAFTGTITQYAILSGGASNTINSIGPASAGKIIRATGLTSQPAFTTATYPDTTTINRILYSSAANTIGEITTANSSVLITNGSGAPSLSTTLPSGLAATNLTLTTPILGTPQSGNLSNCTGIPGGGISGTVLLANGGTSANLTASNGGIVYSTASAMAILAGTSTANQLLISGATAAPSWTSRYIDYTNSGTKQGTIFIGEAAGNISATNITGNTAIGIAALAGLSSSRSNNTAVGYGSLSAFGDGNRNTAVGSVTGNGGIVSTSNDNCFFGYFVGSRSSYTQCVLIGSTADCSVNGLTNAIAIGYGASVSASNCMVLGNGVNVGIGTSAPTSLLTLGNPGSAPSNASVLNCFSSIKATARFTLTGQEFYQASNTDTQGIGLYLGRNRSGDRQIWFFDTGYAINNSYPAIKFAFSATQATIGVVSTDGSTDLPLYLNPTQLRVSTNSVYTPSGGSWLASSDIRIKKNIKNYNRGLKEILKLKPVEFKFNENSGYDESIMNKVNRGLIANEVEEIMPECVGRIEHEKLGEIRSLDITPITYAMVNAIKELNNRLEALEKVA